MAATSPYSYGGGTQAVTPVSVLQSEAAKRAAAARRAAAAAAAGAPAPAAPVTSNDWATQLATMTASGPDYSGVATHTGDPYAKTGDYAGMWTDAQAQADAKIAAARAPIDEQRTQLAADQKLSLDAQTNFTKAMTNILTGGLDGQAGRDYALKTFGGSFLGEIEFVKDNAVFQSIAHDFTEEDFKLLGKISEITAQRPDIADQLYNDVVKHEEDLQAQGMKTAEDTWSNRLKAASVMLTQAKYNEGSGGSDKPITKSVGGALYQWDPVKKKWGLAVAAPLKPEKTKTQWNQKTGVILTFDSRGKVIGRQQVTPNPGAAAKPVNGVKANQADGSVWLVNPRTGARIAQISPPGSVTTPTTQANSPTASAQKSTPVEVRKLGESAVGKVTDAIWASVGAPPEKITGPDGKQMDNPAFAIAEKKYQAWLDSGKSFKSAMTRVTAAIGPSLRKSGFNAAQIKEAAYRIVAAEMDPPPGYTQGAGAAAANASAKTQAATSKVVGIAASQIGKPYVFASGPGNASFDCSELIQYAYANIGITIPRTTYQQIGVGTAVNYRNLNDLQPGDLIFPTNHHVVLYAGNGKVIAAPHTGELVQYQNLSDFGRPVAVRRIVSSGTSF
jgi:cell wall-associated NlpC family hydrolase